jgi:hypothetical protein
VRVVASTRPWSRVTCDVLAVPVRPPDPLAGLQPLDEALGGWLREAVQLDRFEGKRDSVLQLFTHGRLSTPRVLLVGTGPEQDTSQAARRAAAVAARHAPGALARQLPRDPGGGRGLGRRSPVGRVPVHAVQGP